MVPTLTQPITKEKKTEEKEISNTNKDFYISQNFKSKNIKITKKKEDTDITDQMLLVESVSEETTEQFDCSKLINSLRKEYKISKELSETIAKKTEETIYSLSDTYGISSFNTRMISRIAENHLLLLGYKIKHSALSMPVSTINTLVFSNSKENSNISSNNPEAINLGIAEYILKHYNLRYVFSDEVSEAHNNGIIHIHDLGYPQRVYCSSHSIEYIKKYGLDKIVANLQNKSAPAKSAMVLNGHVQTFLASMQSRYAGALGFGFLNILYAPMLNCPTEFIKGDFNNIPSEMPLKDFEEMKNNGTISENINDKAIITFSNSKGVTYKLKELSAKEIEQIAQNLIFSSSQNAFSRGGQTLFIDYNIHTGVPEYMREVPVVGPGGKYLLEHSDGSIEFKDDAPRFKGVDGDSRNGNVLNPTDGSKYIVYGDSRIVKTAQKFALALMNVWEKGDKFGVQFAFPKCDLHVSQETFDNPDEYEIYKKGCELASKNGSTYFMFDRPGLGATLAQCCRLKEKVTDPNMLKHPEKIRFTGFQNVTINLPQAAYKGITLDGTIKEVDAAMELAMKAHLQKKKYIQKLLETPGSPLRALGELSDDGTPYINLDKSTYIIGLIGLNEAVQYISGKELHEEESAFNMGLKIVDYMYQKINYFKQKYNLKVTLEESPAESATQKLAKGDLARFPIEAKKVIKGDSKKAPYYTNSIHLNAGAPVSIIDRIEMQSKFHELVESGSIIHVYCGESQISKESIMNLIEKSFSKTRATQITISPEYTFCSDCHANYNGFKDKCEKCGSTNVVKRTKIVGYFSNLGSWNSSQLEISKAREKASKNYSDMGSDVKWLHKKDETVKIMVFGKQGCSVCESAFNTLTRLLKEAGKEIPVEFFNLLEIDARMAAAKWNVPLDPIPTIVIDNKGLITRMDPEFRRGKQLIHNEIYYENIVKSL